MRDVQRAFFLRPALEVAPELLNARLTVEQEDGPVSVRITEVEAYHGVGTPGPYDAGSHSRDRRTARNASMFGPPGHTYVYFTYGMHYALNLVCSPEGAASGVLLRAGEVVQGLPLARESRARKGGRPAQVFDDLPAHLLARGPGNLAAALGITRETHDGRDLFASPFRLELDTGHGAQVSSGPRVGVSGDAGGPAFPWRFWITGDRTVSSYRPGRNVPRALP